MGKASFFLVNRAIAALAIPLLLASCATSDGDIFAHPAGTNPTASTPTPAPGGGGGSGSSAEATSALVKPRMQLRAFVGADADRLRRDVDGTMAMQATDHFVFVARPQAQALPQIAQLLEHTHRAFYDVFAGMNDKLSPVRDPLVWMVFEARQDYERYAQAADGMDMSWSKAYYSAQTNRVAIALRGEADREAPTTTGQAATTTVSSGTTLMPAVNNDKLFAQITHEAGHQLAFNSGLQKRGVMYPLWVSEGLAANFELDAKGRLGPDSENALRAKHLLTAQAENRLVPLDQWIAYTRVPVGRPAQINAVYGQSWAFFRFLYEHRRGHLHDYLAHMARQQPGRRSEEALRKEFVQIFGDPEALKGPWADYLAKLSEAAKRE